MLAILHGSPGDGHADSSSALGKSARHLPTGRLATLLEGLWLGQAPGLEFRAATEMSAAGWSGSQAYLSFPHTGEPWKKAFPPALTPLLRAAPSSPAWLSSEEGPSWISQWASGKPTQKTQASNPLNHMEWKKGVCSQWYLGTELFQPSGSSLSRFLTPFNDFQKPGHFGPWGISNFPIIPLPDSCWNVPGVLGVGGHVIQLAWMSTGPSFQQALNSEHKLIALTDEYRERRFLLPVSR